MNALCRKSSMSMEVEKTGDHVSISPWSEEGVVSSSEDALAIILRNRCDATIPHCVEVGFEVSINIVYAAIALWRQRPWM